MSTGQSPVEVRGPQTGPAIVFLHGAGANRCMWVAQANALADRYRTVTLDLPGHGRRTGEPFTIDGAVDAAADAIDRFGHGRALVVGLSLGGYVAMVLADRHPSRVAAMVLSGSCVSFSGWDRWVNRILSAILPLFRSVIERKAEESMRKMARPDIAGAVVAGGTSVRGMAQALRRVPGRDYRALVASYSGPVLLLNGERDRHNRAAAPSMVAVARQATVEVVPDSGHACAVTQPEAFTAAVRRFAGAVDFSSSTPPGRVG